MSCFLKHDVQTRCCDFVIFSLMEFYIMIQKNKKIEYNTTFRLSFLNEKRAAFLEWGSTFGVSYLNIFLIAEMILPKKPFSDSVFY